jgi:ubiquinone/menaquinone biosynthesis C-methylase UbiE
MKKNLSSKEVWNSDKMVSIWSDVYTGDEKSKIYYAVPRKAMVLDFVDQLNLHPGSKILELGFGSGEIALELCKRGFEVHGIDISQKFCLKAYDLCNENYPEQIVRFTVGDLSQKIEYEDNTFDAVLAVGILHYLERPESCINETHRVLQKSGKLIVAQRNVYALSNFTSIRRTIRSLTYFFLKQKFVISLSFRAIFLETHLSRFFSNYKNSSFFKSRIMSRGEKNWDLKIKKRVFSYRSLKKMLLIENYKVKYVDSPFYQISEKLKYFEMNKKFDSFIRKIKISWFIFFIGRVIVITAEKKDAEKE